MVEFEWGAEPSPVVVLRIMSVEGTEVVRHEVALGALATLEASESLPLPTGQISRIAFGSCAFQWEEQPIWKAVVAAIPDLYVSLGDAIYGDFDGESVLAVTVESLRAEWQKLADHPEWQHLSNSVPVIAVWDNHDYGHYSAGQEFPLKAESQQIFLDFFGEAADSDRRSTPGIYARRVFGPPGRRVQLILLDTRFFKGPPILAERPEGAEGSLGKYAAQPEIRKSPFWARTQWRWLEAQLRQPAEVRLIASSTQIVADQKGMDEWGNYPHERRRLFDLIEVTGAEGVILLSGNVHFAEVSRTEEGPYSLYDFTSSGLTHVNPGYAEAVNAYRVAGPFTDVSFGLIEIDWDARPAPLIILKAVDLKDTAAFEAQISLSELRPAGGPDDAVRTPKESGDR